MSKLWKGVKSVLGAVAPVLTGAIGGPLGSTATMLVSKALGMEGESEQKVVEKIQKGLTPEEVAAVRQAQFEFEKMIRENNLQMYVAENADRASARSREIAIRDHAPRNLAYLITVGFFGVLGWLVVQGFPAHNAEPVILMVGSLGATWGMAMAYYFGSSSASRHKDETIREQLRSSPPPA